MRPVLLWMSISLDGFFADPDGGLAWQSVDEELHAHFNEVLAAAGAFLDGRVTWQLMADFWPTADEDPDEPAVVREFAAIWRDTPKFVWSRTLPADPGWATTVLREVVAEEVRAMAAPPGGDLVVGGAELGAAFRAQGLLTGYRIFVHPVLLGRGRPLFPEGTPQDLQLVSSRVFSSGVVELRYDVTGSDAVRSAAPGA